MDKVAEMLTKIRNAQMAGHSKVFIGASKLKLAVAKILERENFVGLVSQEKEGKFNVIKINLKYNQDSNTKRIPAIKGIEKVSKAGQRVYVKNKDTRSVKNNFGIAIISTSQGVMIGEESRKKGLGGEYICRVW